MSPLTPLRRWSTDSQARARRNALAANTALTARRLEREDVEAYLRARGLGHRAAGGVRLPEQRRAQ